ncbi:MAG: leucine-rich repeat domain-containing protein, partial [Clostridium paraputrificum]
MNHKKIVALILAASLSTPIVSQPLRVHAIENKEIKSKSDEIEEEQEDNETENKLNNDKELEDKKEESEETKNQETNSIQNIDKEEKIDRSIKNNYFIFNEATNTIIGYSSSLTAPKDIVIPDQINGVDVLHIGDEAFSGQQLTGVVLNKKVQTIGNRAFYNNLGINSTLEIPDSVTRIGTDAFGKTGIKEINIPSKLENTLTGSAWGSNAEVYWKDVIKVNNSFKFNTRTKTIVKNVGTETEVEIPSEVSNDGQVYAVEHIDKNVFKDNKSITSIKIPDSVTSIGDYAFSGTSSLKNVTLGNGVTTIGMYVFENSGITSIEIPDSVTSIGDRAFSGTSSLKNVTLGNGVT